MKRGVLIAFRLRRRLARQEGAALVTCIAMGALLASAGASALVYATQDYSDAKRVDAGARAFSLAEAGLHAAYATLYNAPNPTLNSSVPATSQTVDGGTMSWTGTLDSGAGLWTLRGTGAVHSPVHASDVVRTVSARVRIASTQTSSPNNAVWNYMYSDSLTTCMPMTSSVNIAVPLYVRGNLCLSSSANFTGSTLEVGGTITLTNSSHVGRSPNDPQTWDVHVAGGCSTNGTTYHKPCTAIDRVYSQTAPDSITHGFTKPPVDLPGWYQNAAPGPKHPCTQGSFPPGFDNDSTMNGSIGTVQLATLAAYDCRVYDGSGNLLGRIAWTPGSTGQLTVSGTIFIDGNVSLTNSQKIVYQGSATLYLAGTFSMDGSAHFCGVAACDATWDYAHNMLAIIAGSSTQSTGININNSSWFQGALYAVNDFSQGSSVSIWGPVIARQIYSSDSTHDHNVPIGTLLPGMPATYSSTQALVNEPGSWGS